MSSLSGLKALCGHLSDTAADQDGMFYLATGKAAEMLGTDRHVVAYWFRLLLRDGILERAEHGRHGRIAPRYRYRADVAA